MSKSVDLREAAVHYYLEGHTYEETRIVFGVSHTAVYSWVQKYRQTGDLSNKPLNRSFKKIDPEKLRAYVKEHPDDTREEMAAVFGCCNQAISQALKRHGITRKKTFRYKEQDPQKVTEYLDEIKGIPPEEHLHLDESGFDRYFDRGYGYAPRGEKVYGEIAGRKFHRESLVAARLDGRIIAPTRYQGTMNAALFESWFENSLLPAVPPNITITMDNASFHRKEKLFEIAEKHHVRLIFLPPYSPELNPIEKLWANIKRWLKKNMRNYSSFDDALSAAIEFFS